MGRKRGDAREEWIESRFGGNADPGLGTVNAAPGLQGKKPCGEGERKLGIQ